MVAAQKIAVPFEVYTDFDGQPLESGQIFVGSVNQDPETNPIALYRDLALTLPMFQPVLTMGGYPVYQGNIVNLYIAQDDYSIRVKTRNNVTIFTELSANGIGDLRSELASTAGAGLVGVTHDPVVASTYLAATCGERFTRDVYITDDTFNARASDTDNYAAIQGAIDFVSSTGGNVIFPAADTPYRISQGLLVPDGVFLQGQGWFDAAYGVVAAPASSIQMDGTGYAITLIKGSNMGVSRLGLFGTASADGGIMIGDADNAGGDEGQNGQSFLDTILITGFEKVGAADLWYRSCQRAYGQNIRTINSYTAIKLGANSNPIIRNGNFAQTNVNGKAVDATSGGIGGVSMILDDVYFESCPGQYPLDLQNSGIYTLNIRGFEAMCYSGSGSVTDPAIVRVGALARVSLNVNNFDFIGTGDNVFGTISGADITAGPQYFQMKVAQAAMSYAGAGRAGAVYQFLRQFGYNTVVDVEIMEAFGPSSWTVQDAMAAYNYSGDFTYTPKHFCAQNVKIRGNDANYIDYATPHIVAEPAGTGGATSGVAPALTQTGAGSSSYTVQTYPEAWFGNRREIKISVAGKRTGAVGGKQAFLDIVCGGTTSYALTLNATAADDWQADISLYWVARQQQLLTIKGVDGTTNVLTNTATALDNGVNSIEFRIRFVNASAGDTMTLNKVTLDRQ